MSHPNSTMPLVLKLSRIVKLITFKASKSCKNPLLYYKSQGEIMNCYTKAICITIMATSLLSVSTKSFAKDDTESHTNNETLSELFNCAKITISLERLACQDAEILNLKNASDAKKFIVFDEKSAKDFKKRSFGLTLPKLNILGSENASNETKNVILPVESIKTSGRKLTVVMENGQIWQSLDSSYGYIPKKGKIEARIKTAAFGSFLMKLSSEKARSNMIRVRRIK